MLVCFISILFCSATSWSQNNEEEKPVRLDNSYGLRVGLDLQNIITSLTNSNFQGIELMADYRLSKKYFFAGEIGIQEKTLNETSISTTTDGSYIKLGFDYNVNKNLIGLRNIIFVGGRYGFATFSQRLNRISVATQTNFFGIDNNNDPELESSGLTAHWVEFIGGLKVEVLNNLFLGFSVSLRANIAEEQPDGFDNLFIPGFETTNDLGILGAGYRYFISYHIPLYKKKKKAPKKTEELELKQ